MTRADLTEKILDIKREKGWSWKHIHEKIGGTSPVLLVGALLGQMKLTKPQAANAADLFGLSKAEAALLNEVPMRGAGVPMPPSTSRTGPRRWRPAAWSASSGRAARPPAALAKCRRSFRGYVSSSIPSRA